MDSTGTPSTQEIASTTLPFGTLNGVYRWLPLTLLIFAVVYGCLLASLAPQLLAPVNGLAKLETLRQASGDPGVPQNLMELVWKAFIGGILAFALLFNLVVMFMLQRPGLAWLSVLMAGVLHSQLVLERFGLWFIWPGQPQFDALLHISLPLCLIALCEFTPHFLPLSARSARAIHGISLLAFLHLLVTPLDIPIVGPESFLALTVTGGMFILLMVARQIRRHVYARYYGLAILAILTGAVVSLLRTAGWAADISFAGSAFFLGAAAGSVILTTGAGRLLLEERRKRVSADMQVQREQQMRSRIEHDYNRLLKTHRVTGKPNRAILEETLDAIDSRQSPYTLCIMRLQRFNEIEQALGYRTAEDLLKSYLRQLNSYLKRRAGARLVSINGYGLATVDTINHAFALYRESESESTATLLDDIRDWLADNFREGRFSFSWNPSMGIAHAPEHGENAASLLSSAGVASLNGNQVLSVYDPAIAEWQYRQQILMLDVESGLASNSMWLEYQPKVSIQDAQVRSVEALIRWRHPEFGYVAPDQWIPLAEQVGVIHPVTLWVIERACSEYRHLSSRYGSDLAISVNVSAMDLTHSGFEDEIDSIISRHGMKAKDLILEITETAMMTDPEASRRMIHTLSLMGFRIAMDDFGTGHSSLGTLASFDLDELKIDRSFLKDILNHPTRQRIFRAALELGEALDLDVVVEGVEDGAVVHWLQQFPGLYGQGYFWGKPEPACP